MTIQNALKKTFKMTGQFPQHNKGEYSISYCGWDLTFHRNGTADEITCIYTKRKGVNDDLQTDYFAGTFHDNITQAVSFIRRMTK